MSWVGHPDCAQDPWVYPVPYVLHELVGHQGVGESPPHAAARRSKQWSFLPAEREFTPPPPIACFYVYLTQWPEVGRLVVKQQKPRVKTKGCP